MKTTEHKETGAAMHVYEVGYLIVPTVSEDKVADEVSAIHTMLEGAHASIIAEEFPKAMPLAYTMERTHETKKQKFNEAYFGWVKFEMPVASINDIDQSLVKRSNILRHLITKTVRENTVYSTRLAEELAEKAGEAADAAAGETPSEEVGAKKEMDKSIDALVIG